jgi:hypothetical protein
MKPNESSPMLKSGRLCNLSIIRLINPSKITNFGNTDSLLGCMGIPVLTVPVIPVYQDKCFMQLNPNCPASIHRFSHYDVIKPRKCKSTKPTDLTYPQAEFLVIVCRIFCLCDFFNLFLTT